jgi:hypothetical protein
MLAVLAMVLMKAAQGRRHDTVSPRYATGCPQCVTSRPTREERREQMPGSKYMGKESGEA